MRSNHPNQGPRRFLRKGIITLLIAVAIAVPIRQCLALPITVATDAVSPELRKGNFALVYRLASNFEVGDVLAYKQEGKIFVGRFVSSEEGQVLVSRFEQEKTVAQDSVIGKIVISTR